MLEHDWAKRDCASQLGALSACGASGAPSMASALPHDDTALSLGGPSCSRDGRPPPPPRAPAIHGAKTGVPGSRGDGPLGELAGPVAHAAAAADAAGAAATAARCGGAASLLPLPSVAPLAVRVSSCCAVRAREWMAGARDACCTDAARRPDPARGARTLGERQALEVLGACESAAERRSCEDADECSSSCSRRSEAERPSRGGERPPTGCGAYGMGEQHGPGPSPA